MHHVLLLLKIAFSTFRYRQIFNFGLPTNISNSPNHSPHSLSATSN